MRVTETLGLLLLLVGMTKADFWFFPDENITALTNNGSTRMCDLPGLSKHQRKLCRRNYDHMRYVIEGSHNAIVECKHQFKHNRWNCSTEPDSHLTGSAFSRLGDKGIRETAFVQAIISAGIVHSVARACRRSNLEECGLCGSRETPREDIEAREDVSWCKYIGYASNFAEKFTGGKADSRRKLSPKQEMELHNRRAGRLAVKNAAKMRCKCHGLKGSCSLKTCWIELGDFRDVGNRLKKAYEYAARARVKRGRIVPGHADFDKENLIFLQNSPNFCDPNPELLTAGTQGRLCQRDDVGSGGCDLMCCGRGYTRKVVEVLEDEQCNCTFQWCCVVQCQKCYRTVNHDVCQ